MRDECDPTPSHSHHGCVSLLNTARPSTIRPRAPVHNRCSVSSSMSQVTLTVRAQRRMRNGFPSRNFSRKGKLQKRTRTAAQTRSARRMLPTLRLRGRRKTPQRRGDHKEERRRGWTEVSLVDALRARLMRRVGTPRCNFSPTGRKTSSQRKENCVLFSCQVRSLKNIESSLLVALEKRGWPEWDGNTFIYAVSLSTVCGHVILRGLSDTSNILVQHTLVEWGDE